jgi:hypothetical protein
MKERCSSFASPTALTSVTSALSFCYLQAFLPVPATWLSGCQGSCCTKAWAVLHASPDLPGLAVTLLFPCGSAHRALALPESGAAAIDAAGAALLQGHA